MRKHPAGHTQPLGERRVFRMQAIPNSTKIEVGIGDSGKQGWTLDTALPGPSFLTFRLNGSKKACSLQEAWVYWTAVQKADKR